MDRRAAFETLFHRHVRWVVHQARLVVGERDAEDVAQEVFLRLYQALMREDFDPMASPLGWLRTSTYRAARDRRRRLMREQPAAEDHDINPLDETLMSDTERTLIVRQQWAFMLELIQTLEPERRIVFVMAELDQMTLAEIAELLELSPNTVSRRLQLARADFDAALTRKRAEEQHKLRGLGAILLPLNMDALLRMARALPEIEVAPGARERVWKRVHAEIVRQHGSSSLTRIVRLKSAATKLSTFTLGTTVGVLAAAALGDAHPVPSKQEELPPVPVASAPVVVVPAIIESATVTPAESASSLPRTAASLDAELAELALVEAARAALQLPDPNPERALRLLDLHQRRYSRSHRFVETIARLRRDAQRLVEQKQ